MFGILNHICETPRIKLAIIRAHAAAVILVILGVAWPGTNLRLLGDQPEGVVVILLSLLVGYMTVQLIRAVSYAQQVEFIELKAKFKKKGLKWPTPNDYYPYF